MLQLSNFSKTYHGRCCALTPFPSPPVRTGFKGVNGSSKSTLLKAIAGITPFEGDILLAGQLSVKKQVVAYCHLVNFAEAEPLFPRFLTGRELIHLFKVAKKGPPYQEDCYLESLHMTSYVHEPVGTYSKLWRKSSVLTASVGSATQLTSAPIAPAKNLVQKGSKLFLRVYPQTDISPLRVVRAFRAVPLQLSRLTT